MKNGEENGRDQESHQKRHLTVMVLAKDQAYRRYICDKCLWSVDALATNIGEAKRHSTLTIAMITGNGTR